MMFYSRILSKKQVEGLKSHRYASEGRSFLDQRLQGFWNTVVSHMPRWVAPNLITFVGLVVNIVTCLAVVVYNPNAEKDVEVPQWALVSAAVGLFIYQTLDNIDGKQARRTGSNNPLGELFDHGCDALSTSVVIAAYLIGLRVQPGFFFFILYAMALMLYYVTHWECYVKGRLLFNTLDVTEAHYYVISSYLVFAFAEWMLDISIAGIDFRTLVAVGAVIPAVLQIVAHFDSIMAGGPGEAGTTRAETGVLSPGPPMVLFLAEMAYVATEPVFPEMAVIIMLGVGCATTKLTVKLITAHITRSPVEQIDIIHAVPLVFHFATRLGLSPTNCALAMSVFFALDMALYCMQLVREITQALNIMCFRIDLAKAYENKS